MSSYSLHNSKALIFFSLKKDKFWLPTWVVAIVIIAISFAPIFPAMAKTDAEIEILANTMKSPVMVALTGPVYGSEYTYGIMFIQMMLVWVIIMVAIFNIFLVIRHTRKEEEDGRTELISSLPVGKTSGLLSTFVIVVISNAIISILCGLGLATIMTEGMDLKGCLLFGLAIGVCGLVFAAIAALFAQLCSTSRSATGWSFAILGVFYMLRAYGDLKAETLSLITPFGLAGRVQYFYKNEIWPLGILLILAVIIFAIAFVLYSKRDLGSSLLPERKGPKHAGKFLNSSTALSLKLLRGTIIAWSIVILLCAVSYGSVFGDLSSFYESNEFFKALLGAQGGDSKEMMIAFIATIVMVMTLLAIIPIVSIIFRIRSEEKKGRIEIIYSRAVAQNHYISGYFGIAVGAIILLQILCALGLWLGAYYSLEDPIGLEVFIKSVINFIPTMFFFAGLAVFFVGVLPKATSFVWIYLVYCFCMSYLGNIVELPKMAIKLSVFGVIPHYPAEEFELLPIIIVMVVSVALTVIGIIAYRNRDVIAV